MKAKKSRWAQWLGLSVLVLGLGMGGVSCNRKARHQKQLEQTAREGFFFGYPLVLVDESAKHAVALSRTKKNQNKVPMYQFFHIRDASNSPFRDVLAFDNDMLYSLAWLNLAPDPVVLSVPAAGSRYYVGGLLEAWSDIFSVIGTRATGNKAQTFLIAGPQWQGDTPKGLTLLRSRTNFVWLPIRIYANHNKNRKELVAFQNALKLTPLTAWKKRQSGSAFFTVDTKVDLKQSPRDAVFAMTAEDYYRTLCSLMADNPPSPNDEPMVSRLRELGVVPTKNFRFADLPAETQEALSASVKNAKSFLLSQKNAFTPVGRLVNGWTIPSGSSGGGTDYYRKAYEAFVGMSFLPPQDAVFATSYEDNAGQQLMGENSYKLTFPKGQLPPVNAFWSLTMYQLPDMAFSANRYRRYSISSSTNTKVNPDGSVTVYLQPKAPGKNRDTNWLPSTPGTYQLTLRMYWPKAEVLEGRWNPPVIERVERERMAQF